MAASQAASGKTGDWETLMRLREKWRAEGKTVVWTSGCFDLVHVGHVRALEQARSLGDVLVVGVNDDEGVRRLKGPGRPVIPASDRVEILASLAAVDYAVIFEEATPAESLARLEPEIHCKGEEYAPPDGRPMPEADAVRHYGGRIEFLKLQPGYSTTDLIQRIQRGGR